MNVKFKVVFFIGLLFTTLVVAFDSQANSTSSKQLKSGKVYVETKGTQKTCKYTDKYNNKVVKIVVVNRFSKC